MQPIYTYKVSEKAVNYTDSKTPNRLKLLCFIAIIFLSSLSVEAQNDMAHYVGKYGDYILANGELGGTALELKPDGTFVLRTTDYVYPRSYKAFTNEGKWVIKNGEVILNPALKRRHPIVKITEKQIGLTDSIEIKVNHYVALYENQQFIEKRATEFELLTLYVNKKRKYKHLTRAWVEEGSCAWAPRIRNRVNLDASNTFKIAKTAVEKFGIFTFGFTDVIELKTSQKGADYYEIDVVVPLDKERMPRNKKVIIKGNRAYYYEVKGTVKKSLNHLWKKNT